MSRYDLTTTWRLPAPPEAVARILSEPERLPEWWPSVYLAVRETAPGDARGIGKEVELWTRGWLPYTLRWRFRVTAIGPDSVTLEPEGDFTGRGVWTLRPEGEGTLARYDWQVEARKPLLRRLAWLLKPAFAANHAWAMRRGEESLKLELRRRAARTEAERAAIPPPPGPSWLRARASP